MSIRHIHSSAAAAAAAAAAYSRHIHAAAVRSAWFAHLEQQQHAEQRNSAAFDFFER
jgi:hypothetical protein